MMLVIAERGYTGASIQEIARAADITPGLVHYHFKTKEEILVALVGELHARVESRASAETLEGLLSALLAPSDDEEDRVRARAWAAVSAEAVTRPEVAKVYRAAVQSMVDRFFALGASSSRAAFLAAAVEGYFHLAATCPDLVPQGSALTSLLEEIA